MKKLRFLLFDANVVFQLYKLSIWEDVLGKAEVMLSRVVAEQEVKYYEGTEAKEIIDLGPYITSGAIEIVDVTLTQLKDFKSQFSNVYLEKLDAGEAESLCYLVTSQDDCLICSSDAIVFRVLGCLNRSEQGLSLEEVLQRIGIARSMPSQFSKQFRMSYTRDGQLEGIQGLALKAS